MKTETPKQILIVPPGSLSNVDKHELSQAGFVAIEMEDPSKAVLLMPNSPLIGADDILASAAAGVMSDGSNKTAMAKELCRRILAEDAKRKESA